MTELRAVNATAPRGAAAYSPTIRKGKRPAPDRIILTGVEGVGKSKFGSEAPNPIFLASEDGIRNFDVASFEEPESLAQVYANLKFLNETQHEYRTLVVDTLDWLEPLIFREICRRDGAANIEAVGGGYGKGYTLAVDEWRDFLSRLDAVRLNKGMEVILLCHASVQNFKNPVGPDFDRYEMAINRKAAGVVRQWADTSLFATFETFTQEKRGRVRGISTGARVIHTEHCAAWDAKNRDNLPPTIPLSYAEYAAAREVGQKAGAPQVEEKEVVTECRSLIEALGLPPDHAGVKFVEANLGNPGELLRALNKLRTLAADTGLSTPEKG